MVTILHPSWMHFRGFPDLLGYPALPHFQMTDKEVSMANQCQGELPQQDLRTALTFCQNKVERSPSRTFGSIYCRERHLEDIGSGIGHGKDVSMTFPDDDFVHGCLTIIWTREFKMSKLQGISVDSISFSSRFPCGSDQIFHQGPSPWLQECQPSTLLQKLAFPSCS